MNYIYTVAGTLIMVFIYFILQKKKKDRADHLLIVLNILIGLFLLSDVLVTKSISSFALILQNVLPLFLFPVFIVYAIQFLTLPKKVKVRFNLLFVPGIFFLIYNVSDHYFIRTYSNTDLIQQFNEPGAVIQVFFKGSQLLFIGILIWLFRKINKFSREIRDSYSNIERIEINWLRNFALIYLISLSTSFILFSMQNLGWLAMDVQQVFGIVFGLLVLAVFYLNLQGIKHYTLAQEYDWKDEKSLSQTKPKSKFDVAAKKEVHKQIIQLFEEEQVYLEPKIKLDDLAERLGSNKHLVSATINDIEQKSFYDLVNGYRVNHLKTLLADPENKQFTILSLGLDSGFNSKASLNRIFKNQTGKTPKEFLEASLK